MDTLYNRLEEYAKNGCIPFHMPGHKRNYEKFGMESAARIDITEIEGFDDYHYPQGIIRNVEEQAAKVYGSDYSYYLVNGSSAGLLIAISATVKYGDKILVARNCHKAVYNAIYLNGLMPEYIYPVMDSKYGIMGQIRPEDVRIALEKSSAKVVVITSPTYEGLLSDVKTIADICHEQGAVLIVDEAHGAHFNYSEEFPETAVQCGADLVIESLHKTLPSYTQTAILHAVGERINIAMVRKYLSIYQSSSPSYIFMAGINRCIDYMISEQGKQENEKYITSLKKLRNELDKLNNIKLYPQTTEENEMYHEYDISKLVLCARHQGVYLYEELLHKYHIQAEMAAGDYIILMTAIGDKEEWYKKLLDALTKIDAQMKLEDKNSAIETFEKDTDFIRAQVVMPPRSALEKDVEEVLMTKCTQRIAAEWAYAYPPGIPLIYPGERITKELLVQIEEMRKAGVCIKGLQDEKGEWIVCIK